MVIVSFSFYLLISLSLFFLFSFHTFTLPLSSLSPLSASLNRFRRPTICSNGSFVKIVTCVDTKTHKRLFLFHRMEISCRLIHLQTIRFSFCCKILWAFWNTIGKNRPKLAVDNMGTKAFETQWRRKIWKWTDTGTLNFYIIGYGKKLKGLLENSSISNYYCIRPRYGKAGSVKDFGSSPHFFEVLQLYTSFEFKLL